MKDNIVDTSHVPQTSTTVIVNQEVTYASKYIQLTYTPIGKPVALDINPIARLNFGVTIFNYDINRIGDIELMSVIMLLF